MIEQPNPNTNFKVIDKRSPDTQARKAEMPDHLPDATKMMFEHCPFCGRKNIVAQKGKRQRLCMQCGAEGPEGKNREEADVLWNRRTPAPMTSVIEWNRYDGTPETLPTHNVLMVDNGHCHSGFVGKNGNRPCWIASVAYNGLIRMIREVSIGDLWAYLPTPPEEVQ